MKISHKIIMCMLLTIGCEMYAPHEDMPTEKLPGDPQRNSKGQFNQGEISTISKTQTPPETPKSTDLTPIPTVNDSGGFFLGNAKSDSIFVANSNAKGFDAFSDQSSAKPDAVTGEKVDLSAGNKTITPPDTTIGNALPETTKPTPPAKPAKPLATKDSNGNTIETTTNNGNKTVAVDSNGNTIETNKTNNGNTTETVKDKNGNFLSSKTTDSSGKITETIETIPSKLSFIKPTTKTTRYDATGKPNFIVITDNNNKIISTQSFTTDGGYTTSNATGKIIETKIVAKDKSSYTITNAKKQVIETKTVTEDKSSYTITNAKGQITEESSLDATTGKTTTIKYNKSKNSALDKSSTTTITDPAHPDQTTTEIADINGKLIQRTIVGADGIPHTAKITDIKNINTQDVTKEESDLVVQAVSSMAGNLARNNTMGKAMDITFPAVRENNARIRNLPESTRQLRQATLARIESEQNNIPVIDPKIDPVTGKSRLNKDGKPMSEKELKSFYAEAGVDPTKNEQLYRCNTAEKLLQNDLDNVFGKDTTSGESNFSWKSEFPVSKAQIIKALQEKLFKDKTTTTDEQSVADTQDEIKNTLSNYDPKNSAGNPPPFRTTIDKEGNCSTIITNESGVSSNITADKYGKITGRKLTVINPDGKSPNTAAVFTTTIDATGKSTTTMNSGTMNGGSTSTDVILTEPTERFIEAAHNNLTTKQIAISMIKASLWTTKQVAPNLIKLTPPMQIAIVSSIAPILALVKVVSMLRGSDYKDPVIQSFIQHSVEMTMGNRRGFQSADPNRVFTKGTAPSKAIQALKGHSNIAEAHVGSAIYEAITTFSFDPIAESYAVAFPEQRDPTAEYYRSLDDIIIQNSVDFMQKVFTRTDTTAQTKNTSPKSTGSSVVNEPVDILGSFLDVTSWLFIGMEL